MLARAVLCVCARACEKTDKPWKLLTRAALCRQEARAGVLVPTAVAHGPLAFAPAAEISVGNICRKNSMIPRTSISNKHVSRVHLPFPVAW